MSRFLSPRFAGLEAYTPGEQPQDQQYVKLNTNESPYPPSPEVLERISAAETGRLNLYPDPTGRVLKEKLAALYGVEPENVFLSNGSDDILNFSFMAFCDAERGAAFPEISYGFYPVYADLYHVPCIQMPLKEDFSVDYRDYCGIGKMVVIANPNAPTGMEISISEIEEILRSNPQNVVLIDEAYVDFGGTSCVELTKQYDNLLVVQTFSKSRSMAGMRIGYAMGDPKLIRYLNDVKYSVNSYTMNYAALQLGVEAVEDEAYFEECCARIVKTREHAESRLRQLGFTFPKSYGNFIFASHKRIPAKEIFEKLKADGIYVRYWDKDRIRNHLRITVGTDEQMEALYRALETLLE